MRAAPAQFPTTPHIGRNPPIRDVPFYSRLGSGQTHMTESLADIADQQDEPSYFCYSATLRIFGSIPDLDEITRNLGLDPTHVHRRGELRGLGSQCYEQDAWLYEPPIEEHEPLHVHIDALWRAIRQHKEYLLGLKQNLKVDVFLGYRFNSDTAGVEVPYESLEIFTELKVPLGLSIIVV